MNKTKLKYVKYTKNELDRYVRDKNSCISLTTSEMHVGFPPSGFANFQESLTNILSRDKIGKFDTKLNGIVLDVRNIKVFGTTYPVHDDDPINHINIRANFYLFQPRIGAVVKGVVKHISHSHVAVLIYRVFNVSIRFNREHIRDTLSINQQISFRIKKFDLSGAMPYIEGEFVGVVEVVKKIENTVNKHSRFDDAEIVSGGDSGISTEETNVPDKKRKIVVKKEKESSSGSSSDSEESSSESESDDDKKEDLMKALFKNAKVKQEKFSDSEEKTEPSTTSKNKTEQPVGSSSEESSSSSSESSSDEEDKKPINLPKNIKQEKASSSESSDSDSDSSESSDSTDSSDDDTSPPQKGIKKEKSTIKLNNFKPILIKSEPMSDAENSTPFKKPPTNYRRSLNVIKTVQTPENGQKRRRTTSISEQLDSLVNEVLGTSDTEKKNDKRLSLPAKKFKSNNDSMDISNVSASSFQSPTLSSTLKPNSKTKFKSSSKIKQEPESGDEVGKKKRKKQNGKSDELTSLQNDLFKSIK